MTGFYLYTMTRIIKCVEHMQVQYILSDSIVSTYFYCIHFAFRTPIKLGIF